MASNYELTKVGDLQWHKVHSKFDEIGQLDLNLFFMNQNTHAFRQKHEDGVMM